MSDETAAFTATIKAGPGFEAPWLVIRADTAAQLKDRLREAYTDLAGPLVATAQVVQAEWAPGAAPQAAAPAAPAYQAPAPQAAPAPAAPPGGQQCVHGEMKWRTAKPDSGKDWKGWFCPAPRGTADQCKPQFVR